MRARLTQMLNEFVNRETELGNFQRVLESLDMAIYAVWGDGGVGKSLFMAKMVHEVAQRNLRKAEVVWSETNNHDYLAVMRKLRDDLGVDTFKPFTDLVNFFTVPQYELKITVSSNAPIEVARGARIEGSQVGDIAGIIVKDVMLTDPRADLQVPKAERRKRLTDCFITCMAAALASEPAVVFFDAVEKMSEETEAWLRDELLEAACADRLGKAKFVLCGRKEPHFDRSWNYAATIDQLCPLSQQHIAAYLEKRGVGPEGREKLALMLLTFTGGNALEVANRVEVFLKVQDRQDKAA
jgi:GTPase SAR1 family protein